MCFFVFSGGGFTQPGSQNPSDVENRNSCMENRGWLCCLPTRQLEPKHTICSSLSFWRSDQMLTMSVLTEISVREGEAALEKLPAQVEKMQTLLDSKFAYSTLSEVER